MAWYDSAGPAGAGFMKANELFSKMQGQDFENALRQAQAQQLMQQMEAAPQESALKQQEADYRRMQLAQAMQMHREKMGLDERQFGLEEKYKNSLMNPQPKPLNPLDAERLIKLQFENKNAPEATRLKRKDEKEKLRLMGLPFNVASRKAIADATRNPVAPKGSLPLKDILTIMPQLGAGGSWNPFYWGEQSPESIDAFLLKYKDILHPPQSAADILQKVPAPPLRP